LSGGATSGGSALPFEIAKAPKVDFAKFGPIQAMDLNKIKRATAANMARNWITIPHVTQFGDADITEMEAYRQKHKQEALDQGVRLTPIAFILKAIVKALKLHPNMNASLSADGKQLIVKDYYHIGVAVDTPEGLVVPVIRDVDQKSVMVLAKELGEVSAKARDGKLKMSDMQGGTFTISSLGGIGGTAFTPIVNAPEVAILGVSKSAMTPVYNKESKGFDARLMLPLCMSYDHRVIDGAQGARFVVDLASALSDVCGLLL
jgi:pyruvate dehydrogenase E2 component (dihydrolipoamide acetyltransferase)